MPKVSNFYESNVKHFLGIWLDLESKVKYRTIQVLQLICLCPKPAKSFCVFFFIDEYQNRKATFSIDIL